MHGAIIVVEPYRELDIGDLIKKKSHLYSLQLTYRKLIYLKTVRFAGDCIVVCLSRVHVLFFQPTASGADTNELNLLNLLVFCVSLQCFS